jgi:hypothetical protein
MKKAAGEKDVVGRPIDRKFPCPHCEKRFVNAQMRRTHLAHKHRAADEDPPPPIGRKAASAPPTPPSAKSKADSWGYL